MPAFFLLVLPKKHNLNMSSVYSRQTILSPYYLKINSEAFNVGNRNWVVSRRSITMKIQTFSYTSTKNSQCIIVRKSD